MEADFEAVFRTRTRDEWGETFASTDACVTPVLSMAEAPASPHNNARDTFVTLGGVTQPAPSPRLTGTVPAITAGTEATIADLIRAWAQPRY